MFIAIVGTKYSGKKTMRDYLTQLGCICLHLSSEGPGKQPPSETIETSVHHSLALSASSSPISKEAAISAIKSAYLDTSAQTSQDVSFTSANEMLDYVTRNWRHNFVTTDLVDKTLLEEFVIRPFFLLANVDAPLLERFRRANIDSNLEDFVREHDYIMYKNLSVTAHVAGSNEASLHAMQPLIDIHIVNSFESVHAFHSHLTSLNILDPDRVRPRWDAYFMRLASLASLRSNCMKRRVGAILVRNNRILATGYNGTPRGLRNCNEGGCARCNGSSPSGQALDECVCLHAEENALLEAGHERVGEGAVLYCNTCPCLRCTVKIIQTGVKEVIYNLSYKVDDASMALFAEANVRLRRYALPK